MNRLFAAIVAIIALAACSGPHALPAVSQGSSNPSVSVRPLAGSISANGHLYVTHLGGITVLNAKDGTVARTINTGSRNPVSVAVDVHGNIYVTEGNGVSVFGPTGNRPIRRITDGISHPSGLTFDANGNLYVTSTYFKGNDVAHGGGTIGEVAGGGVTVYAPGATSPKRKLTDLLTGLAGAIAVSSHGYVYVVNTTQDENHANVVVFGPAGTAALRTIPGLAYMLALDSSDRLYVTHSLAGDNETGAIDAYSVDGAATHLLNITRGVNVPMSIAIDRENVWVVMGNAQSVNNYDLAGNLLGGNPLRSFSTIAAGPGDSLFVARHATSGKGSIAAYSGRRLAYVIKNVEALALAYAP